MLVSAAAVSGAEATFKGTIADEDALGEVLPEGAGERFVVPLIIDEIGRIWGRTVESRQLFCLPLSPLFH